MIKSWAKHVTRVLNHVKQHNPCPACGEAEFVCLDFHHAFGKKEFGLSQAKGIKSLTVAALIVELGKCAILCANCHRKLHAGRLNWYEPQRIVLKLEPWMYHFDEEELDNL